MRPHVLLVAEVCFTAACSIASRADCTRSSEHFVAKERWCDVGRDDESQLLAVSPIADDVRSRDGVSGVLSEKREPHEADLRINPNPGGASGYDISFAVISSGPVELEIYNVAGQRVAGLMREWQGAGRRRIHWNGATTQGARISAGVYFARLTAFRGTQTTKFVHLRS